MADNKNKIFVPLSIEDLSYKRGNYFFSDQKLAYVIGYFFLVMLLYAYMSKYLASLKDFILFFIFIGYFTQLYLRKVVFEENKLMDNFKEYKNNRVSDLKVLWGIHDITRDGIIKFSNLSQGICVRLGMGGKIGIPDEKIELHFRAIEKFYKNLAFNGFRFILIDIQKKPSLPESVKLYNKLLDREKNEMIKRIVRMELNYLSLLILNSEPKTMTYYVIYVDRIMDSSDIERIKMIFSELVGESLYSGYFILDSKEFLSMFADLYNIGYININDLNSSNNMVLKDVPFTTLKRFDIEGYEINKIDDVSYDNLDELIDSYSMKVEF